jgi:branched-chain amino acid transport system substrate-binding protein
MPIDTETEKLSKQEVKMERLSKMAGMVCLVALLGALAFFSNTSCGKKEPGVYKIGAILPLTGSGAVWGQNAKMSMDIALDEINKAGGVLERKIELMYEDDRTDPTVAVSALRKLIDIDHIQVVIGVIPSSNVLAMAPICEKEHIVLLSSGASNPKITYAGEYIFRNWQSDALEGDIDAKFAYDNLKWRKPAIIYVRNAYGEGLKDVFINALEKLSGKVTLSEGYKQGDTDFRSILTKIKRSDADGIYMPGYPEEMPRIIKQARELDLKQSFLSVQAFSDPDVIKAAVPAAEGMIYSMPAPPDSNDPVVKNYYASYQKKYGKKPGVCGDTSYDALKIIVWAIENAKSFQAPDIQKQLTKLKDFPGAAGKTTFDEYGDAVKDFVFMTIKNGKPTIFKNP